MTTKLIKVDGYWIVVSDEKITLSDTLKDNCYYLWNNQIIKREYSHHSEGKLLLFSQNPEHNLPTIKFSDEVAKELGIVDVEKLAETDRLNTGWEDTANLPYTSGFIRGYNQHLSDNVDKKFTLEDMRKAFQAGSNKGAYHMKRQFQTGELTFPDFDKYIQSLTKEEYFCELEMEDSFKLSDGETFMETNYHTHSKQPKITNNSVFIKRIWK